MVRIVLFSLLISFSVHVQADVFTIDEWVVKYTSKCTQNKNRVCIDKTKRNFQRMLKYKKLILSELDKNNLPGWLATIPFIESDYTPNTISKAGAVGMWQIMPRLLQHYLSTSWSGINYNYKRIPKSRHAVNIGYDPKISTKVACKFLKHLYEKYGKHNHVLVVRAYNAGETRINRALKGIGKPLSDETLNYYNQLMALQVLLDDMVGDNVYRLR